MHCGHILHKAQQLHHGSTYDQLVSRTRSQSSPKFNSSLVHNLPTAQISQKNPPMTSVVILLTNRQTKVKTLPMPTCGSGYKLKHNVA